MALTQVTSAGLKDGEIVNADLHSAAAVAGTKIAPDFGSQNIDTTGNILLDSDSNKLKIGDGEDLQIFHNGSHSYIKNSTGTLHAWTDDWKVMSVDNSKVMITATENGAVELYYNNSKKFETVSNGVLVSGSVGISGQNTTHAVNTLKIGHEGAGVHQLRAYGPDGSTNGQIQFRSSRSDGSNSKDIVISTAGDLELPDGQKVIFGTGDDLQIYHDGSDDKIQSGSTNSLIIATKYGRIMNAAANETQAKFYENGQVELYYDNAKRFETTSSGVKLGNITQTLLWPYDGNSNSRSWGFIGEAGSYGIFELKCSNGADTTLDEIAIRAYANAGLQFFHNNTIRCEVQSTGLEVTGGQIQLKGNEGGEAQLQLIADEGDDNDDTWRIIAHVDNKLDISNTASGSWEKNLRCYGNGAVELFYDNSVKFQTTSTGIKSYGHVSLNTADGHKALFGAGEDLSIFHDGTDSYIDNATGNLQLRVAGTEKAVVSVPNGGVELYHNNTKKLETTSAGAMIAGTSSSNVLSLRNTTLGNGVVGILFSTQNHSGGREKAALFHQETHGQAHYGGDLVVCLNGAQGGATQVSISDRRATFKKDGGICFNSDTAYANALDDYEEGTWSPDPHDGSCNHSNSRYIKVGKKVTAWSFCWSFSDTSTNDQVKLKNLPFAPASDMMAGPMISRYTNDTVITGAYVDTSSRVTFFGNTTGDYGQLRHNDVNNANFQVKFVVTYDAA